ncbi:hypothetical protein P7C70_g3809, partial [Phenoliferia sp. Uapishka_3]
MTDLQTFVGAASAAFESSKRLHRRPAARRAGSSSALTPRALKNLQSPEIPPILEAKKTPRVKYSEIDVDAWRAGVVPAQFQPPYQFDASGSLGEKRKKRRSNNELVLFLESSFAFSEPLELSLRIPMTPTDFETPSTSGYEVSSHSSHSSDTHFEGPPTASAPPLQDVLPSLQRYESPSNSLSFLEAPSTLHRVNSRPTTKPKPSLARKLSGKNRAVRLGLEVAVPPPTYPISRNTHPLPASPAPFSANLRVLNSASEQIVPIPSKAARLLGITQTVPRFAPRPMEEDSENEDDFSSSSSLCSCLPPMASFASSPTSIGSRSPAFRGSPTPTKGSTPTLAIRNGSPWSGKGAPWTSTSPRHSPTISSPSPLQNLREKSSRSNSLPDVSSQMMLRRQFSFEEPSSSEGRVSAAGKRFWDKVRERGMSQPEVAGEIIGLAKEKEKEREEEERKKEVEKEEEEVEVLQRRIKVRRMTRDDWEEESERLRMRIRESLGY